MTVYHPLFAEKQGDQGKQICTTFAVVVDDWQGSRCATCCHCRRRRTIEMTETFFLLVDGSHVKRSHASSIHGVIAPFLYMWISPLRTFGPDSRSRAEWFNVPSRCQCRCAAWQESSNFMVDGQKASPGVLASRGECK